ncbi:MAG TPA: glycoside hydrolase family 3 C-terminal domain-containing protein [Steroidobacteraceae bacterium]|nr:glycoside hydrolase family 3 C-terminal domain-containing protein [Steroidobacteraceae bacterium]
MAHADAGDQPWMNTALDADQRAALVLAQMTREEKQGLVFAYFGTDAPWKKFTTPAEARAGSAGYVPGIARLGIPPQWATDAGLGVATQGGAKHKRGRTALASGLATAATWDPELALRAGAMIGAEARASGFNVMLAGSVNLVREPRNGRNFEYAGEDPLLAGVMVGAQIRGIESNHVISTIKHFALNDQETDRNSIDVRIDPAQARMSDLLAFQIAIEQSDPGSVMCSYNKVAGDHACENAWLLTDVLRRDWGWGGFVMSDWGATHSTAKAALAGLDQQSGYPFDDKPYFGELLLKAVASGELKEQRLDQMAGRILRTMFAKGVIDHPVTAAPLELPPADLKAHALVSREGAEQGMVLLRNEAGVLPLKKGARVAVIGGYADKGVLAGGGSSLVYPVEGNAVPGLEPTSWPGPIMYYPSSPLRALQSLGVKARFSSGKDRKAAAKLAAGSDVALVFVTQWTGESVDKPLTLPDEQDALVSAVAAANPRTVVVLETGGAVFMPWIGQVQGVLQAWYPGSSGGDAIANVLTGRVNPSGHLPISFPRDAGQFARATLEEHDAQGKKTGQANYREGATVGYKWFDAQGQQPLFPFGFGLSYTKFEYGGLRAQLEDGELVVSFEVRNTGEQRGADVPQVYVSPAAGGWEAPKRLAGWRKVDLKPGESAQVSVRVDPRLLGVFHEDGLVWRVAAGEYTLQLGHSAADLSPGVKVQLPARELPVGFQP